MGLLLLVLIVAVSALILRATIGTPGLLRGALTGALLIGGIGFALGFFGPILLTPESNQGPLLGIVITGPLGVVIGGIGGALMAHRRARRIRREVQL